MRAHSTGKPLKLLGSEMVSIYMIYKLVKYSMYILPIRPVNINCTFYLKFFSQSNARASKKYTNVPKTHQLYCSAFKTKKNPHIIFE